MIIRSPLRHFFLFLIFSRSVSPNILNCSLITTSNDHCSLSNDLFDIKSTVTIVKVIGKGFETQTLRTSTKEFSSSYHSVKYFPENFAEFFPNLEIISITHASMKEIRQKDLKQFPMLTILDLSWNDIEIIERNLFEFNRELREIFMEENQIFSIDPKAFCGLNKLEKLKMGKVNFGWTKEKDEKDLGDKSFEILLISSICLNFLTIFGLILICCKRKSTKNVQSDKFNLKKVEQRYSRKFSSSSSQGRISSEQPNNEKTRNFSVNSVTTDLSDQTLDFTPQMYQEPIDSVRASNLYQEVDYQSCSRHKNDNGESHDHDQGYSQVYEENAASFDSKSKMYAKVCKMKENVKDFSDHIYQECSESDKKLRSFKADTLPTKNSQKLKTNQKQHKTLKNIKKCSKSHQSHLQLCKECSNNFKLDLNYSAPIDCLRSKTSAADCDNKVHEEVYAEPNEAINIYDEVFEENFYENSITMERRRFE